MSKIWRCEKKAVILQSVLLWFIILWWWSAEAVRSWRFFLAKSTIYLAIFPKKCKKMQKNEKKSQKICIYQKYVVILRCLSKTRGSRTPKRKPKTEKK